MLAPTFSTGTRLPFISHALTVSNCNKLRCYLSWLVHIFIIPTDKDFLEIGTFCKKPLNSRSRRRKDGGILNVHRNRILISNVCSTWTYEDSANGAPTIILYRDLDLQGVSVPDGISIEFTVKPNLPTTQERGPGLHWAWEVKGEVEWRHLNGTEGQADQIPSRWLLLWTFGWK
jgi:hypothetical protein